MATNIKIDRSSLFDGDAIKQGGIGNYILLINKEDLDAGALTFDGTTNEIETITLDTGKYAYKFESSKGSAQIIMTSPLRAVSAIDGFDHQGDVRIVEAAQEALDNIKRMRFQKVCAIIPLADGRSMLYGRKVGMRISDFQMSPGDADTGGSFQIVLKTPENDPPEIDPPHFIESTFDITTLIGS